MSTILEALRRLEREREDEAQRASLTAAAWAHPEATAARFSRRTRIGLLGAGFLLAGVAGWLVGGALVSSGPWQGSERGPVAVSEPAAGGEVTRPVSAESRPSEPLPAAAAWPRPASAVQPHRSPIDEPAAVADARAPAASPTLPAPSRLAKAAPPPTPSTVPTRPAPAAVPSALPDGTAPAAASFEGAERVEGPMEAAAGGRGSPGVGELPEDLAARVELPEIAVAGTVWHPRPERRLARIRARASEEWIELHEGDAYAGWVVVRIAPSAVSFEHGGVSILRRVGAAPAR